MKKIILFLSVLFAFTVNNASARTYYYNNYDYNDNYNYNRNSNNNTYTYNNNNNNYQLKKQNSDLKKTDYNQNTYHKTKTIKPYVGFELSNLKRNFTEKDGYFKDNEATYFRDSSFGGSAILGLKAHKYFGFEGFYQRSFGERKNNTITAEIPVDKNGVYDPTGKNFDHYADGKIYDKRTFLSSSYGIDLLAYLPLNQQLDLLASVGVGQYEFETRAKGKITWDSDEANKYYYIDSATTNKDFDSAGIRVGLGLQYNIEDTVALRGMVRYVKLSKDDYIKNLVEMSLGVFYLF
ncbi:MAG: outer membrane beta-barrel protein [Alphaproteobacteria bacterium]|nr:outer membrane beta-barrel protein [Alphaproteobacteria bacterium]